MALTDPYVDVATYKNEVGVTDSSRDTEIAAKLLAASRAIDLYTGRGGHGFWLDDSASDKYYFADGRTFQNRYGEGMFIDEVGSLTDFAVSVGSGSSYDALDSSGYILHPRNAIGESTPAYVIIRVNSFWEWYSGIDIKVTARWGWPSVPNVVLEAVKIQTSRLMKRKDSPEGVLGSAEWGTARVSRVDPDVQAMIKPLVRA